MRVLVTGATGFIGSWVVRQLAGRPEVALTALVRPTSLVDPLRKWLGSAKARAVHFVAADLKKKETLAAVLNQARPEVIIHLATAYAVCGTGPGPEAEAVDYEGTLTLLDHFLHQDGRRFIAAGTCFEYGPQEQFMTETTPCQPLSDYARAKLRATEAILARGRAAGVEALVLRVFSPFGPREDPARIVPQFFRAGLSGRPLELSPGGQVRDFLHVAEVARAFVRAALHSRLPSPQAVYNVCSGVGHSLRTMAATVASVLGRPLDLGWGRLPYRPGEMMSLVGCRRAIGNDLGWCPRLTLAEGVRRTAAWWSGRRLSRKCP